MIGVWRLALSRRRFDAATWGKRIRLRATGPGALRGNASFDHFSSNRSPEKISPQPGFSQISRVVIRCSHRHGESMRADPACAWPWPDDLGLFRVAAREGNTSRRDGSVARATRKRVRGRSGPPRPKIPFIVRTPETRWAAFSTTCSQPVEYAPGAFALLGSTALVTRDECQRAQQMIEA